MENSQNKDELFLSLQELIQLPGLDQAVAGEFPERVMIHGSQKTKAFCSKCGINWASLWSQDENDETYEFCPICKTDYYLEDPLDGPLYVFKMFQGILNVDTGDPYVEPAKRSVFYRERKPFDYAAWYEKKELTEQIRDKALDEYTAAIDAGKSQDEAEQIYFEILQSINPKQS